MRSSVPVRRMKKEDSPAWGILFFESLAFPSFPDGPVLEQCHNAPCGITGTKGMALLVFLLRLVLALAGGNV